VAVGEDRSWITDELRGTPEEMREECLEFIGGNNSESI